MSGEGDEQTNSKHPNLRRWQIASLGAGFAALIVCAFGFFSAPAQFFRSYLLAFVFWTGLSVGCLGVLMLQFVTGGAWGSILRRALFAASKTLPVLALFFVPLIFGLSALYIWTNQEIVHSEEVLRQKEGFLNVPFFIARQAIYFAVWIAAAFFLSFWEHKGRETEDARYQWRIEHLSAAGMFVLAVTVSLWLIDLVMSLEPRWYSTIYPLIWITGEMLAAFAFAIPAALYFDSFDNEFLTDKRMRDLGNLLLAFVMLWAYCSFSQYLLIWSGNLREEIPWYLPRVSGVWGWIAVGLIVLHFFAPFFLLLFRDLKQSRKMLSLIAIFILVMRFVDAVWLIEPAFSPESLAISFWDLAATAGIGGVWLACFLWLFERGQNFAIENERREEH